MPKPVYAQPTFEELDLEDLEDAVGGLNQLQAPDGGSIRETQSSYKWWGMTYQQTSREAVDAGGNVVGSEVVRPGSVWSDHTQNTAAGSTTEYSTGTTWGDGSHGGSANGSITTTTTNDGHWQVGGHVDGEVHATGDGVNYSADVQGNANLGGGADGAHVHGDASGGVHATDAETGYGVNLTGQTHADVWSGAHGDGNSVGYDTGAKATASLSHDGETVIATDVAEVGSSGHVGTDEHGNYTAGGSMTGGVLGENVSVQGSATHYQDGHTEGEASITNTFGTGEGGQYGASSAATYGVHGTYNADGSYSYGDKASLTGEAHAPGMKAEGELSTDSNYHYDSDHNYTGSDYSVDGKGSVDVGPFGASASGHAQESYDAQGNLSSYSGNGEIEGHAYGASAGTEGSYDSGGSYDNTSSHDDGGSYDTSGYDSHDAGGTSYDSGGSSYDSGGSSYDSGGSSYDTAGDSGGSSYDSGGDSAEA